MVFIVEYGAVFVCAFVAVAALQMLYVFSLAIDVFGWRAWNCKCKLVIHTEAYRVIKSHIADITVQQIDIYRKKQLVMVKCATLCYDRKFMHKLIHTYCSSFTFYVEPKRQCHTNNCNLLLLFSVWRSPKLCKWNEYAYFSQQSAGIVFYQKPATANVISCNGSRS